MTSETKIDPQLQEWMERTPEEPIPVLIEMAEQPVPPPAIDRGAEFDALSRQGQAARGGVREALESLGVAEGDIESFAIVNALAVALSAAQIQRMAEREDVRFVRYNGQANVAI